MTTPTLPKQVLKKILQNAILNVKFKKKDGTERIMKCTLKEDLLPTIPENQEPKQQKAENMDVLPVWDIEQKAFRSFRMDSVISWEPEGYRGPVPG